MFAFICADEMPLEKRHCGSSNEILCGTMKPTSGSICPSPSNHQLHSIVVPTSVKMDNRRLLKNGAPEVKVPVAVRKNASVVERNSE